MCAIVIVGEVEIETVGEFQEYFGFLPEKDPMYGEIKPEYCLCCCDLEKTFKDRNIEYGKGVNYIVKQPTKQSE